ncbi:hypothetical protein CHS0354_031076 [Potamilus streckersoni]|uniref:Methyltransferase FkbM domain-containing protein n=1 Tax=Potamilus streckersoni TaxID=2493646 RepID=A0AAE0S062_9BIVA|nr:hypothetical protein CHS0354_031076 [Potamilus streckersoni]
MKDCVPLVSNQVAPCSTTADSFQAIFLLGYIVSTCLHGIITPYKRRIERLQDASRVVCVESKTDPNFVICPYQKEEDLYVSGSIRDTGIWDSDLTHLLKITLSLYKKSAVIDLGAFIGYFTFLAGALGHDVVAVEPFNSSFKKLKHGLALNDFPGTIKLLHRALSNKPSLIRMGKNQKFNLGNMQVHIEEDIDARKNVHNNDMVEAITMNDLRKYIHSKQAIVKMDIEGYECKALETSSLLFQELFIPYIFMEWFIIRTNIKENDTACPAEDAIKLVNYLVNLGYTPIGYHPNYKLLDPCCVLDWKIDDILWQHKNAKSLLPFVDLTYRE